jgi:hypothetical protein
MVSNAMPSLAPRLVFLWDRLRCDIEGSGRNQKSFKKLAKVYDAFPKFNHTNTVLVDDSPYKSLLDPANTITIPTFTVSDADWDYENDTSLFSLLKYLEAYQQSPHVSIQDFIQQNPFSRIKETKSSTSSNSSSKRLIEDSLSCNPTSMSQQQQQQLQPEIEVKYHRQLHVKTGAYIVAKQQEPVVEILEQWSVSQSEIEVKSNNRPKFRYLDPNFKSTPHHTPLSAEQVEAKQRKKEDRRKLWMEQQGISSSNPVVFSRRGKIKKTDV